MFKKIFIVGLVLIVTVAVAVSAYNAVRARPAQAANSEAIAVQPQAAAGAEAPAAGQTGGEYYQDSGDQPAGGGNPAGGENPAGGYAPAGAGQGGGYRGGRDGGTQGYGQGGGQALPAAGSLSEAEARSLQFMIEEEKLARDVYQALFEKWGVAEFQNISQAEQMHMNSVQQVLDRYGLTSLVQAAAGSFSDPELQRLYTELVARGSQSLAEAIKVGGLIEEIDIIDLQELSAQTANADILRVYNNLLNGSYNHLRAFANSLSLQTGETYQPQKLSAEAYQAILSGSAGNNGNGYRGGQGAQGQGQGAQGQGAQGQGGQGQSGGRGRGRGGA